MSEKKKLIGLLSTAVLACGVTGIGVGLSASNPLASQLMSTVLGGFSVNLTNSFLDKLKFKKIKEWFVKTHPDDLNHDLQIAIFSSILKGIDNIEILYSSYLSEKSISKFRSLAQKFKKKIDDTFPKKKEDSLTKSELSSLLYDDPKIAIENLLAVLPDELKEFDLLNHKVPFSTFFKENILTQFQLSFAETLKDEQNSRVWIAFQRFLLEDINTNIKEILNKQDQSKTEILDAITKKTFFPKLNKKQIKQLTLLSEKLNHPISLNNELTVALDNYIGNIKGDIKLILSVQVQHYGLSSKHFELAKEHFSHTERISEQLSVVQQIVLKTKKRNTLIFTSTSAIFITIGSISFYLIGNSVDTFNTTLFLVKDTSISIEKSYPDLQLNSKIYLNLNKKVSEEISSEKRASFLDIQHKYLNKTVTVNLDDKFWTTTANQITLQKGSVDVLIRPNEQLANIGGRVLSRDGSMLISNAKLFIDGITFFTDSLGNFNYAMPINLRKKKYVLRVEKHGYIPIEVEYLAGSPKEIRISKYN